MEDELTVHDAETGQAEAVDTRSEQEEKDFLNSLDDDFDPATAEAKAEQANIEQEAAAGIVFVGLMTIEQTMKTMVHPDFTFNPEQAEGVALKVAPLIVKYGGNPPPWLAKYMDEIMAVAAIGMLGLSSFMQVKQLKAADIAKAKAQAKNAANDNERQEAA
ncbi:hypothetical protein [Photobacterium sp. TY1-4]|uniref:hypothetical protein n=1 Tax=Photobacterium sp. TY1-4 TaxID=2899122 RepID=UPI0021C00162|nr:hypothetical protein [Photobacterium sp. TY1-4]UXI04103.1 hypothetical protein NH461_18515 [Photobacterium sp. TY1-4]